MILIVDSGSTKTDWIGIDDSGKVIFESQTLGLNPQVLDRNIIKERIVNNYDLYKYRKDIDELSFYGLHWDLQQYRKSRESGYSGYPLKPYPKPLNHRYSTPKYLSNTWTKLS